MREAGNGKELFQATGRGLWSSSGDAAFAPDSARHHEYRVIIGVAGFFVVVVILIVAGAMVLSSRTQAEALVRISEKALESQVRTVAISPVSGASLDRFLESGGLVLEKEGSYYLDAVMATFHIQMWKVAITGINIVIL
ncbi:MAG TPA: hypothetical protein VH186_09245 [Chloroflexia bacterium]|nr:hypothetical protein [Chloroflexia bacterium]